MQLESTTEGHFPLWNAVHYQVLKGQYLSVFVSLLQHKLKVLLLVVDFILRLDGCHLRGLYRGVLLTAVGPNANNMIFLLAILLLIQKISKIRAGFWEYCMKLWARMMKAILHSWTTDKRGCFRPWNSNGLEPPQATVPGMYIYANFKKKWARLGLRRFFWLASKAASEIYFKITVKKDQESEESRHYFTYIVVWNTSKPVVKVKLRHKFKS